jgi:hypothetical protein
MRGQSTQNMNLEHDEISLTFNSTGSLTRGTFFFFRDFHNCLIFSLDSYENTCTSQQQLQ